MASGFSSPLGIVPTRRGAFYDDNSSARTSVYALQNAVAPSAVFSFAFPSGVSDMAVDHTGTFYYTTGATIVQFTPPSGPTITSAANGSSDAALRVRGGFLCALERLP